MILWMIRKTKILGYDHVYIFLVFFCLILKSLLKDYMKNDDLRTDFMNRAKTTSHYKWAIKHLNWPH